MDTIGGLEEIILLIVLNNDKLHAVAIADQYEDAMGKHISIPAIHVVLKRMEKKGWISSRFGEPSAERGGKRKRIYWATGAGFDIVKDLQERKASLWKKAIKPSF